LLKDNILSRMQLPGSPILLAILRILLGLQIFYSSGSKLFNLLQVVDGTTYTRTIFPQYIDDIIVLLVVPLQIFVQVLSVFMILGLFTRYILPLLFVGFLLLFSYWYGHFDAPVP